MRKDPETIVREEVRAWLRGEASEATVAKDIISVLDSKPRHEARVFAARLSDAALEYLVATEQQSATVAEEPTVPVPEAPEQADDVSDHDDDLDHDDDEPGSVGPTDPNPAAPAAPVPEPDPVPVDAVTETVEDAA